MSREATVHLGAMESVRGVVSRLESLHLLPWPYRLAGSLRSLDTVSYAEMGRARLVDEGSWALCTGLGLTWPSLPSIPSVPANFSWQQWLTPLSAAVPL